MSHVTGHAVGHTIRQAIRQAMLHALRHTVRQRVLQIVVMRLRGIFLHGAKFIFFYFELLVAVVTIQALRAGFMGATVPAM